MSLHESMAFCSGFAVWKLTHSHPYGFDITQYRPDMANFSERKQKSCRFKSQRIPLKPLNHIILQGERKPFDEVVIHYGDPHAFGQSPITFVRQVGTCKCTPSHYWTLLQLKLLFGCLISADKNTVNSFVSLALQ